MKRILSLDAIKAITMVLVVWGHCMQYIGGYTFGDHIYSFIYSFHMPLFIIASGYLFSSKISSPLVILTKRLFVRLMVPCMFAGGLFFVIGGGGECLS